MDVNIYRDLADGLSIDTSTLSPQVSSGPLCTPRLRSVGTRVLMCLSGLFLQLPTFILFERGKEVMRYPPLMTGFRVQSNRALDKVAFFSCLLMSSMCLPVAC